MPTAVYTSAVVASSRNKRLHIVQQNAERMIKDLCALGVDDIELRNILVSQYEEFLLKDCTESIYDDRLKSSRPSENRRSVEDTIREIAKHFIATAMDVLEDQSDLLEKSHVLHLAGIHTKYVVLTEAEDRITCLKTSGVSSTAVQVAAQFYFSDALEFLRTVHSIIVGTG
ncbi:hypothetical protein H0H81_001592 [Sphagnurus paluster]|uniref:Uncharacterized protein n=1 Tax=Sphagnurus paluster TaxID=117069 RepID=A0A9P7FY87_9AGAR|nr:hypothetical protein H0H81_001592 [Sphagnurus paluster]